MVGLVLVHFVANVLDKWNLGESLNALLVFLLEYVDLCASSSSNNELNALDLIG
jgi:hypothetical protein